MAEKIYKILLNDKLFGTTKLEFGDPPMCIVSGQINFVKKTLVISLLNNIVLKI